MKTKRLFLCSILSISIVGLFACANSRAHLNCQVKIEPYLTECKSIILCYPDEHFDGGGRVKVIETDRNFFAVKQWVKSQFVSNRNLLVPKPFRAWIKGGNLLIYKDGYPDAPELDEENSLLLSSAANGDVTLLAIPLNDRTLGKDLKQKLAEIRELMDTKPHVYKKW